MNSKDERKKVKKSKLFSFKNLLFDFVRITGALPTLIALRPKFYYADKKQKRIKGAALVVSNHNNFLDPVRLYTAIWRRRLYLVATKELFKTKIGAWFFGGCGVIPVDPDNPGLKTVKDACARLDAGDVVGIFPEGHINRTDEPMLPFKSGVLLMAMKSNAPILPVYVKPVKHRYERHRIAIGTLINLNDLAAGERLSITELDAAAEVIKQKVADLASLIK